MEQKPAVVMPPCPAPTRSVTTASSAVYPSNVNGFPLEAEELMAMVSEITNGSVIDDEFRISEIYVRFYVHVERCGISPE